MRRSHRVIVEVTFDQRVTAKQAARFVRRSLEMDVNTAISEENLTISTEMRVKEAERVIQAEIRQRQRVLNSARG